MAYYNYDEWVKRLTDNMWETLSKQIIKACNNIQTHEGGFSLFKQRVMNEFTNKYHIIQVVSRDLSDRELTTLLTYDAPLNRLYHLWACGIDNRSESKPFFDKIDELVERQINYIIQNYDPSYKGDKAIYYDRIMAFTGKMDYDPTGDVISENDPNKYDEAELDSEEDLEQ